MLKEKVEGLSIFKGGKIVGSDFDGASRGLAVFWNNKWIQGDLIYHSRNMMNVRLVNTKDNFSWVLTNVYAPNTKWGRKALWEEISFQRKFHAKDKWLVIGDFNTPLKDSEKWGGNQTNLDNRLDLMHFIDSHMLHGIELHGIEYTWTNKRIGKDLIQVRLDRALISNEWILHYKCSLSAQVRVGSDHYPIFFSADQCFFKKNFPFRFEKMWTLHPNLESLIQEWWNINVEGTALFRVAAKLKNVKKSIKFWNKTTFGNIFENKNKIVEELKDIQDKIQADGYELVSREEESDKLVELHDIITKEEMFWRQ